MAEHDLILVTGITGYVGKFVARDLLAAGYRVRGTLRLLSRASEVTDTLSAELGQGALDRLELVEADLLDDRGWADAMQGVAAVMHVAAAIRGDEPKDSNLVIRPALEGTMRVMRFAEAAGVKRVIYTSSIATVGYGHGHKTGRHVYDESYFTQFETMRFTWAYCIGKTKAERFAWEFARDKGMELTTIHPGAIIGPPLDTHASISIGLVTGLLNGRTSAMPSNGFSIIDVRDVSALHVKALETPAAIGERYLATSDYIPFAEVGDILRAAHPDWDITRKTVPDWIIKLIARFGGPARQIINDIGVVRIFNGAKGEALLGRKFISARDSILATAERAIALGLARKPEPKA